MEKLAAYIKQNRFTQSQAANAIGCSESALSLWLSGRRKIETLAHAVAIEKWTGGEVSVRDLV
jgi:DNA-binding transcriptional regulator YdaS (Cro superfamily)